MIEIGRTVVSMDLLEEFFLCDLEQCKGACCVEGDSGAPLTGEEASALEEHYPIFREFLPTEHREVIENEGFSLVDQDGDLVTPLVGNRQCAYTYITDEGILKCAVERAWAEGLISFRKPVSCHLFPVRITEYRHFDAVNYQKLEICRPGRDCGRRNKLPLWQFLREPLIRRYGEEWFVALEAAARYGH
ncbi:MAG: DUF3109 family protein [Prolixibacteraceae bacterium]|jgi:hypothetical protein|nr:DUF3109 family protein [Prolixibacteraceae bacterium]NLX27691.1 DUF3109 family protein [Bacteroidales bacterium]HNQ38727.1 DUF3109 family protein [Prolixibacteraceae bacterium]